MHEIEDKTGTDEEDIKSIHKSVRGDDPSLKSAETIDDEEEELGSDPGIEPEQQPELEDPLLPRPPKVRRLDSLLDGKH